MEIVKDLLSGKTFFYNNPMNDFLAKLKVGVFTPLKQKEEIIESKLYKQNLFYYYEDLVEELKNKYT